MIAAACARAPAAGDPDARAIDAVNALYASVDGPTRLADYDFTEADIPEAARRILAAAPVSNPVGVTEARITALLADALSGASPGVARSAVASPAGSAGTLGNAH